MSEKDMEKCMDKRQIRDSTLIVSGFVFKFSIITSSSSPSSPKSIMEVTGSGLLIKTLIISSSISSLNYCAFPSVRRGRERSDSGANSSHQGLFESI